MSEVKRECPGWKPKGLPGQKRGIGTAVWVGGPTSWHCIHLSLTKLVMPVSFELCALGMGDVQISGVVSGKN